MFDVPPAGPVPPFLLSLPHRLVSPKSDEGGSRTYAGAFRRFIVSPCRYRVFGVLLGGSPGNHAPAAYQPLGIERVEDKAVGMGLMISLAE